MWILWKVSQKIGVNFAQTQEKMPLQMNFKVLRHIFFKKEKWGFWKGFKTIKNHIHDVRTPWLLT